ncbi:hypothetical protein EMIT093MI4_70348 [Pseudomonas sp. IT-93MI4]
MGAGLLAKASYQLASMLLTHRIREQARSHTGVMFTPANSDESISSLNISLEKSELSFCP